VTTVYRQETTNAHPDVMTIDEVARYLRLAPRTVYKLAKSGNLPGRKIANRWRFHQYDIEAWVRSEFIGNTEGGD
jgi:excisionase family DNA binding protein